MALKVYRFEWFYHPDKDEQWFAEERNRSTSDAFAAEVLISYARAASAKVFTEFTNDHILEGDYQFNPDLPVYRALDFGRTCSALWAQRDSYGRFIFFKEVVLEPSSTIELAKTVQSLSYQYASHVAPPYDTCDPAGNTVSFTANTSDIKILNDHGIYPKYDKIQQSKERLMEGISLVKYLLSERNSMARPMIMVSRKGCPTLVDAFQAGYRYKILKTTNEILDQIDEKHPYEDVMDCLRYTCMQYSQREAAKKPINFGATRFEPTKGYHNRRLR